MKKKICFLSVIFMILFAVTAYGEGYSKYWDQDFDGVWHIYNSKGQMLTNCWLCDDAVPENGLNVWYLIDANGDMVSAPLVQDLTENYYSLETEHNGHFGMLRYQTGVYNAIYLELESRHNGSFAAIKNENGLAAMKATYGVKKIAIDNDNCVYTSRIDEAKISERKTSRKASSLNEDDEEFMEDDEEFSEDEDGGDEGGPGGGRSEEEYEETGNQGYDEKMRKNKGPGTKSVSVLDGKWYSEEDPEEITLTIEDGTIEMEGGSGDVYEDVEYVRTRTDGAGLYQSSDGTYFLYYSPDTFCIVTSRMSDPEADDIEVMTFFNNLDWWYKRQRR